MEYWKLILIIVGSVLGLLLLFLFFGWVAWMCLKPLEKKMEEEHSRIQPFEEERISLLKDSWSYIDERNIGYKRDFRNTFEKAYENISASDQSERRMAKETIDFALLYTRKLLEEKCKNEDRSNELITALKDMQVKGDGMYQAYDKLAIRYNAVLSMITVKAVNKMAGKHRKSLAVMY